MSVVIAIVTSMFCSDILQMMRTPENIFEGAYAYLLVTFIGVPFTFFYNLLSSIIRALGDSKTPFWFLLLSTVLNIVLDLFCILVLGWGVAGAAIATVISQGLSAVLCYIYMYRKFDILQSTPKERRFQSKLAKTLLYIGVPMGLQFSITAIGSIMLQSANNALGTACVAAFTAAMRIKMFFMCPFESLGMAMATYSGQNYGAGKPERFRRTIRLSAVTAIAIMCVGLAFFEVIPGTLLGLFSPSEEMLTIGRTALRIIGLTFPLAGFCIVSGSVFQALGTPFYSLIVSVCRQICVLLPVAYLLSLTGRLELVWWSFPIAELVSLTLSAIFLRRTLRAASERLSQK